MGLLDLKYSFSVVQCQKRYKSGISYNQSLLRRYVFEKNDPLLPSTSRDVKGSPLFAYGPCNQIPLLALDKMVGCDIHRYAFVQGVPGTVYPSLGTRK